MECILYHCDENTDHAKYGKERREKEIQSQPGHSIHVLADISVIMHYAKKSATLR